MYVIDVDIKRKTQMSGLMERAASSIFPILEVLVQCHITAIVAELILVKRNGFA
nr:MAG TPA: hypothetical protein [Caudoviricetes sp.]